MAARFLDTNILVRLLTRDDEEKAARALLLIQRVESGDEKVITSPMVLFEAVFILQRRYGVSRAMPGEESTRRVRWARAIRSIHA